ncbi:MAG: protein kinase [Phycisphaerales bacterium]|nr:protein kinase [Phycisphaerales bacterium]
MTQRTDEIRRAIAVFDCVCDLPRDKRPEALDAHCNGNEALRAQVERMLAADENEDAALADSRKGAGAVILSHELAESESVADVPQQIGRYKVVRQIGRGGMGVVYEAEQENPSRTVALKILPPGFGSPAVLRRFQREANALGRMRHPGITQIFEAGVAESESATGIRLRQPFIAMELVPGVPIDDYVQENALSINEKLQLFAMVCDAIQHAHDNGVVHRDLKPNNILVERDGQPKVLDFGVSRETHAEPFAASLQTHAGQIVGTIPFMSPEQVQGDPDAVDERTDVYSLGVVLYDLLSGRMPHDLKNRSIPEAIRVIQEDEPSRLSSMDRAFRGDIDTILYKALEKNKERRYASPAAIAADIRRYLAHEPLQARPVSSLYQLRKFTRRNKTLVIGVIATVVASLIGAVVATVFGIRANHNARLASEREANARKASYRASISAAAAALRENDIATAELHLLAAPESLRNWDWDHLSSRMDQSLRAASFAPQSDQYGNEIYARGFVHVWFDSDSRHIHLARLNPISKAVDVLTWKTASLERLNAWSEDNVRWFAPDFDGDRLVVASNQDQVSIRNSTTGKEIRHFDLRPNATAMPPSTQQVAEKSIEGWTSPLHGLPENNVSRTRMVFSQDGRRYVGWNNEHTWLFNNDDSDEPVILEQPPEGVSNAVFTPDGRYLVITGYDRRITLFDIAHNGDRKWLNLDAHRDAILALAISPDGSTIVTGGEDRLLKTWDTESGRLLSTMVGHRNPIYAVAFDHDGKNLVSASADRIFVWSTESPEHLSVMRGHKWIVSAMGISPDGSMLVSSGKEILVWDVQTSFPIARLSTAQEAKVHTVSFSPDGRRLLVNSVVFDMRSGEKIARLDSDLDEGLEFVSTGRFIVGNTQLRDADSYAVLSEHPWLSRWSIEPNGRMIASAKYGTSILSVFKFDSFELIREWNLPVVSATLLLDNNRTLAVAMRNYGISLYDVESGDETHTLRGHSDIVTCIAKMPERDILLSGSQDRTVRLWDLNTMAELIDLRGHLDTVHALAITSDGRTIFSASGDYTIRRWGVEPLRDLLAAREDYRERTAELTPQIDALFNEHSDPATVADQIEMNNSLSKRDRQIAHQIILRRAIDNRQ